MSLENLPDPPITRRNIPIIQQAINNDCFLNIMSMNQIRLVNDNLGIDPSTEIFSRYLPFKRPV